MASEAMVHVRLNTRDEQFLDEMVEKGYFSSKSDVLRTALRLYQYSELCEQAKQARAKEKSLAEIMKELKSIRRHTYRRLFGAE